MKECCKSHSDYYSVYYVCEKPYYLHWRKCIKCGIRESISEDCKYLDERTKVYIAPADRRMLSSVYC
jgi:hypothetical protein